ncbi:MAG: rhamnulokinase, partial [Clostridia bacterium]|nr:rhamnulokinase [Clostridia bacterium]
ISFLKNIIGLWLIQESRRQWKREGTEYSFAELEKLALASPSGRCLIDPDDPVFVPQGDIPGRIREYCRSSGQPVPEDVGAVMRCIYESIAGKYASTVKKLEKCTGKTYDTLHVIGGGVKDGLLLKMTAETTGMNVVPGPIEATALGNVAVQLIAEGELKDIAQARSVI